MFKFFFFQWSNSFFILKSFYQIPLTWSKIYICRVGFVQTFFLLEPKVSLTKELVDETHHEESTKKVKEGFC